MMGRPTHDIRKVGVVSYFLKFSTYLSEAIETQEEIFAQTQGFCHRLWGGGTGERATSVMNHALLEVVKVAPPFKLDASILCDPFPTDVPTSTIQEF